MRTHLHAIEKSIFIHRYSELNFLHKKIIRYIGSAVLVKELVNSHATWNSNITCLMLIPCWAFALCGCGQRPESYEGYCHIELLVLINILM
jgi:hypothetical protein